MTRRPPALTEPIKIAEWWRNRSGQSIRVWLLGYAGRNLVDIRTWTTVNGRLEPSSKGHACEVKHLPQLAKALAKAEAKAQELGLLKGQK